MKKTLLKIVWRLTPILILLTGLFFPSCGFVGLLFDGDDGGDGNTYYNVTVSYNYSGALKTVDTSSPLYIIFVPLDEDRQITDDGFSNSTYRVNYNPQGYINDLLLEKGAYAVLGYIDDLQPYGDLNMDEVYGFYGMKDFLGSIPYPDYIMVDSSTETWKPHFELNDSFVMDGFIVASPLEGDTIYGEGSGYIVVAGLSFHPPIYTIDIVIDTDPPSNETTNSFPVDEEIFFVNMTTYTEGWHTLNIVARDIDSVVLTVDQPPAYLPVRFYYVPPDS